MEAIKANDPENAEKLAHQHMINAYDNMVKNGLFGLYGDDGKTNFDIKNSAIPAEQDFSAHSD